MSNKAAAPRVTESERQAARFFYWGFAKDDSGKVTNYTSRVAYAHRWPNMQWSTEKLIDITGALFWGEAFCCEVKEFDGRNGRRFEFSSISPNQADFLGHASYHDCAAFLWLGVIVDPTDRRRINHEMYLIPWDEWRVRTYAYCRTFKNGSTVPWKSIDAQSLREFFSKYQLREVRIDGESAWFTQTEIRQHDGTGWPSAQNLLHPDQEEQLDEDDEQCLDEI